MRQPDATHSERQNGKITLLWLLCFAAVWNVKQLFLRAVNVPHKLSSPREEDIWATLQLCKLRPVFKQTCSSKHLNLLTLRNAFTSAFLALLMWGNLFCSCTSSRIMRNCKSCRVHFNNDWGEHYRSNHNNNNTDWKRWSAKGNEL